MQAEVAGLAEDVVCQDRPGCQDTAGQRCRRGSLKSAEPGEGWTLATGGEEPLPPERVDPGTLQSSFSGGMWKYRLSGPGTLNILP